MKGEQDMNLIDQDRIWLEETLKKFIGKMEWVSEKSRDKIPATTVNGVHDDRSAGADTWTADNGLSWWTNGFWGGILWQLYHETGRERYSEIAGISEKKLDQCFTDYYGLHHDVGFMWLPTAVADYKLTGNEESKKRALHAAGLLAGRFNPAGKFIRAWNDGADKDTRGWAIIDSLLNIPLLYWASEETKDPRYRQIAMLHADMAMNIFIRPDGSSNHIVEFDPENGDVVKTYGGQGYENGSSWTRGQSWALYGFVISYRHTRKKDYLDTAKRVANYFAVNIPEDGLIPVDFRQPKEPCWMDDTAAAIAACGFIELSKEVEEWDREIYFNAAMKLLKALTDNHCDFTENSDGMLTHCSGAYHMAEHHVNLVYADYFLLEALLKLKGNDYFMW